MVALEAGGLLEGRLSSVHNGRREKLDSDVGRGGRHMVDEPASPEGKPAET